MCALVICQVKSYLSKYKESVSGNFKEEHHCFLAKAPAFVYVIDSRTRHQLYSVFGGL